MQLYTSTVSLQHQNPIVEAGSLSPNHTQAHPISWVDTECRLQCSCCKTDSWTFTGSKRTASPCCVAIAVACLAIASCRINANIRAEAAVVLQLSTKRVITMEWIEGCKVNDQTALLQASIRPQDVAVLLLDAFAEMTYVHGFVHGDPHPGNILVRPAPHQGQATGCSLFFVP